MTDRVIPFSTAAIAYGQPLKVRAVAPATPATPVQPVRNDTLDISAAAKARSTPTHSLAAAKVPGRVNFEGAVPTQTPGAMPIYSNPADRNTAATGVDAGRIIDIQG